MAEQNTDHGKPHSPSEAVHELQRHKAGVVRTLIAGGLMGIANIIPGLSGGTMILALGVYERFVEAVADVTRFRFRFQSVAFITLLALAAVGAIAAMTYPIDWGLTHHHHVMFALFIGLTLGGVPVVWREMQPVNAPAVVGAVLGLLFMAGILVLKFLSIQLPAIWIVFLIAGIIAAAAMVLPGISGSYLLLVAGLYRPIIEAIKNFFSALKGGEWGDVLGIGFGVGTPVALGIIIGIAGLTNLLKALLRRHHSPTMGFLMGLLIGSVFGLYPFQDLMDKGEVIAEAHAFTLGNILLVLAAIVIGFFITLGASRIGGEEPRVAD